MTQPIRAPGEVIASRYRLERRLAEGGIGEVWLAHHLHLRQDVAIKFLKDDLVEDPEVAADILARFRLESQVSAMLGRKTAHVVNVYDAGDSEVGPFLAMEFVAGRSLGDELEALGPIHPERLAMVLDQMADALGIAHAAGVVHRDIKPANVLVCDEPDGSIFVKIADFGIAKTTILELPLDRPKDTTAMTMVGTPDFMSPEQLQGSPAHATMDVWALGVTAYELLTGRLPFEGKTRIDMIIKIMNNAFDPPSSRGKALPAALDAWFSKALAKVPEDRFASVREMSEAFRDAVGLPAAPPRSMAGTFYPVSSRAGVSLPVISHGPSSHGPSSQGPSSQGPRSQGPSSQGPSSQGPISQGPSSQGPISQGPSSQGPISYEPIAHSPISESRLSFMPTRRIPVYAPPTLRAASLAQLTRPGGARRAILAGVVLVVLLAGGSLIVRATLAPAEHEDPAAAKGTTAHPTDTHPIGASSIGAPPPSTFSSSVPEVLPADPTSTLPPQSPTRDPSKPRSTGAIPPASAPEIAPPPSVTVSVPPTSATPSSTVPKKVNPSNVF